MPDSTLSADDPGVVQVVVYGYEKRHRVRKLIRRMAQTICLPGQIFRVDKLGKLLLVLELNTARRFYVRVRKWSSRDGLPVVEWTLLPSAFGYRIGNRAKRSEADFKSALRISPMLVPMRLVNHAITDAPAS